MTTKAIALLLSLAAMTGRAQSQQLPMVYSVENTGSHYEKPLMPKPCDLPVVRELPDPLEGVGNFAEWSRRRSNIGHMIQHYGIGSKPAVSPGQVSACMEGDTALVVEVRTDCGSLTLHSEIRYPKTGQPPYALMIGTSRVSLPRQLFDNRPIAIMTFHEKQVNDYGQWGSHHERGEHPFDQLYPDLTANGAYSEWAWGLSRLIDGLQLLGPEVTKIDMSRIGVTGCSYAGKMALYCGAFDERVALTIAQEPGGGGAAAWRTSHELTLEGRNLEDIDKTDYHWFLESQRENFRGDSVWRSCRACARHWHRRRGTSLPGPSCAFQRRGPSPRPGPGPGGAGRGSPRRRHGLPVLSHCGHGARTSQGSGRSGRRRARTSAGSGCRGRWPRQGSSRRRCVRQRARPPCPAGCRDSGCWSPRGRGARRPRKVRAGAGHRRPTARHRSGETRPGQWCRDGGRSAPPGRGA